MIERSYSFTCNYCGEAKHYVANTEKSAKEVARREDSWILHGKHGCFCSEECYLEAYQDYARMINR